MSRNLEALEMQYKHDRFRKIITVSEVKSLIIDATPTIFDSLSKISPRMIFIDLPKNDYLKGRLFLRSKTLFGIFSPDQSN